MPYPVNRTDGTQLTSLEDFRVDSNSTSLTLMGRGVVNYGRLVAENFVKLLENFTSPTPPIHPTQGQIWFQTYDPTTVPPTPVNKIKVYLGGSVGNPVGWVTVGGAYNSPTPPPNPEPGDLWYNPGSFDVNGNVEQSPSLYFWRCRGPNKTSCGWQGVNHPNVQENPPSNPTDGAAEPLEGTLWWMLPEKQLWVYDSESGGQASPPTIRFDGTPVPPGWTLVGPHYQKNTQTRVEQATVQNTTAGTNNVLKVFSDDMLVGVFVEEPFIPQNPGIDFPGFSTYKVSNTDTNINYDTPPHFRKGLNLNTGLGAKLVGVAENSELLSNVPITEFIGRGVTDRVATYPNGNNAVDLGSATNHWKDFYTQRVLAGTSTVAGPDVAGAVTLSTTDAGTITDSANKFVRGTPNLYGLATMANDAVNAGRAVQWATTRATKVDGDVESPTLNVDGTANWNYATAFSTQGIGKIRTEATTIADAKVTQLKTELSNGTSCVAHWCTPRRTSVAGVVETYGPDLNVNGDSDWTYTTQFSEMGKQAIRIEASAVFNGSVAGLYVPLNNSSSPTAQHNLGNPSARWGTIYAAVFDGTATRANYADLAERYHADAPYEVGTVMVFGGVNEVTASSVAHETGIVGIVSESPAYLMNAAAGKNDTHPAIGIHGRLPVRVIGPVKKFDYLVASDVPGVAKSLNRRPEPGDVYSIIGRALESKLDAAEGLVLSAVGFK